MMVKMKWAEMRSGAGRFFLITLLIAFSDSVIAQERAYWEDIQKFKQQDSLNFPPKKAILFVGSSSIRMWKDLQKDFPKHRVINRGFGGSGLSHLIDYANDIIIPYAPKQVVIYSGENDFFIEEGVTPTVVANRFIQLFRIIREKLPKTHITVISLKPSIRRQALMPEMARVNVLVNEFLKTQKRTSFINIFNDMLDSQGNPRKDLFIEDNLHMNEKGYAIWQDKIEPHLKRTKRVKSGT
jgi:lysophospholipase L1-like esterase